MTDWLAELEARAREVEALVAQADLASPVPDCDGWDLGELLRHLGAVHRMVTAWTSSGRRSPAWGEPGDDDVRRWYSEGWPALLARLESLGPDAVVPTWNPAEDTASFWHRRMVHELVVHSLDAHRAAGAEEAWEVSPELAADGVDEALRVFLGGRQGHVSGTGKLVQVRVPGRWWAVSLHAVVTEVGEPEGGPFAELRPDAVVRGPAPEVYRWVWGRSGDVVDSGDHAAVHEVADALSAATT